MTSLGYWKPTDVKGNTPDLWIEFLNLSPFRNLGGYRPQVHNITAATQHITQIIIGESQPSRWKHLIKGSFTQRLMRLIHRQNIDLHIIATEK
jgi:hypothetical protein